MLIADEKSYNAYSLNNPDGSKRCFSVTEQEVIVETKVAGFVVPTNCLVMAVVSKEAAAGMHTSQQFCCARSYRLKYRD